MSVSDFDPAEFLGASRAAAAVREQIADVLACHGTEHPPPPILLRGEAGVGKSLLAKLIHRAGPRPDGPFVDLHCAAIPDTFLEAELFGHKRGATRQGKPGLIQVAHGGTLFLDHVTDLSPELQAKLLQVLKGRDQPLDVWILSATHADLSAAIDSHRRYREAFDLHETPLIESFYQNSWGKWIS
jgi:transcriptional regulator with PAS, ATPase and Fis domain